MSEIQTLSGSELQSIELSDAELQSIDGGVFHLLIGAAILLVAFGAANGCASCEGKK